ncbi:MAG: MoxR family ATPase, partial [Gammaproteobacteria bacterium]|nr:MoxR family ATPase [Gammaproteobacteria bacterium]
MKYSSEFYRYRGDGTTASGEPARTNGERGQYIADTELVIAVNTALAVEQPLLVTGEAGTGKTALAYSIAAELELGDIELFTVRSDQRGRELLYQIDNMQRFFDAQIQDERASDRHNYLELGPLGRAFQSDRPRLVLIDEIDKAPRDFPNDLLHSLDKMELVIQELDMEPIKARHRPVVVITSNRESQLPKPFLRRCVFHHIEAPDEERLGLILAERLSHLDLDQRLREHIIKAFLRIRQLDELEKKPATGELLAWARVLHRAG